MNVRSATRVEVRPNGGLLVTRRGYAMGEYIAPDIARAITEWVRAEDAVEQQPERKPWEDARLGEVWALRCRDLEQEMPAVFAAAQGGAFISTVMGHPIAPDRVIAGRRIWPEDAS